MKEQTIKGQKEFSAILQSVTIKLLKSEAIPPKEMQAAFDAILTGGDEVQIAAFLGVLAGEGINQGINSDVLQAARESMLQHMIAVDLSPQEKRNALDIVGTGGDHLNTLNVSTLASILVAAYQVPVAKHGNRAVSSSCGTSDVLQELGYTPPKPSKAAEKLAKDKFILLFAPYYHPAMKNVAPIRNRMKIPTIFNSLGPLCNPCRVPYMVIGAVGERQQLMMAKAIRHDVKSALIIGNETVKADEILSHGKNSGYWVKDGDITPFSFTAEDTGFRSHDSIATLKGGDKQYNAQKIRDILDGKDHKSCFYTSAVMTAAVALYVMGKVPSLREGSFMVANSILNKKPQQLLAHLIAKSDEYS